MNSQADLQILFDIDKTLLNTSLFRDKLVDAHVEHLGIDREVVLEKHNQYQESLESQQHFDYLELAKMLAETDDVLATLIANFESNVGLYPKYEDVDSVLQILRSKNVPMGIFSEGVPHFQKNKLKNLRIDDYLESDLVFITLNKRTEEFLQSIPEGVMIVDDNPDVIDVLVKYGKFVPVYLNRKNDEKHAEVLTIHSLEELPELYEQVKLR